MNFADSQKFGISNQFFQKLITIRYTTKYSCKKCHILSRQMKVKNSDPIFFITYSSPPDHESKVGKVERKFLHEKKLGQSLDSIEIVETRQRRRMENTIPRNLNTD